MHHVHRRGPGHRGHRRARLTRSVSMVSVRQDRSVVLVSLARASLARGHWRVACRRYLMLRSIGSDIPEDLRVTCERHVARLDSAAIRSMTESAQAWADMLRPHTATPTELSTHVLRLASPFRCSTFNLRFGGVRDTGACTAGMDCIPLMTLLIDPNNEARTDFTTCRAVRYRRRPVVCGRPAPRSA